MSEALPAGSTEQEGNSRRRFLGWTIGGIAAFLTAAIGVPAAGTVASAMLAHGEALSVRLEKLTNYPVGQPTLSQFTLTRTDGWLRTTEGRGVWVVRTSDQDVTVFNGRCTHLGCAYNWRAQNPNTNRFVCPCHDGVFGLDGKVVSGPPPRPLDTLPVKVADGFVVIEYQDFRSGVPDKTPT